MNRTICTLSMALISFIVTDTPAHSEILKFRCKDDVEGPFRIVVDTNTLSVKFLPLGRGKAVIKGDWIFITADDDPEYHERLNRRTGLLADSGIHCTRFK
jgi:hypothetical protein